MRQAKSMAVTEPTLMLMNQNGYEKRGWRCLELYWPIFVTQENVETAVYTLELINKK